MVPTRYTLPEPRRVKSARARLGAPDAKRARFRRDRHIEKLFFACRNCEKLTTRFIFSFPRARSFRRAGRHTSNVKKWVITLVIGTVTGILAFCMEHSITVLVRARLKLISRAARAAACLASPW